MRFRRPLTVVVGAVAAVTLLATPAAAASHGPIKSQCTGTRQESYPLNDGGRQIGRVELWYSSVNGGQNCVMTYNSLAGSVHTEAEIFIDDDGDGDWDRNSWDRGNYSTYAGASYRDNTNGKCVWVYGQVSGGGYFDEFGSGWVHCG